VKRLDEKHAISIPGFPVVNFGVSSPGRKNRSRK